MNILFENVKYMTDSGFSEGYVAVDGNKVSYVGSVKPEGKFEKTVYANGDILVPGFVNSHTHIPMTLFRGLGSNVPLDVWLNKYIFPIEDKLNNDYVRAGAMCAIAEMIRGGTVSFSDMYFFCDIIAEAAYETGMKANISRSISHFDPTEAPEDNYRIPEMLEFYKNYNGIGNGRIKVDFSLHSEYTTTESMVRYISGLSKEYGTVLHIHMSETEKEQKECIERHGMTPVEYFENCGAFNSKVNAAHCVYATDSDIEILKKYKAVVSHNIRSNLKLGSGVMPFGKFKRAGVTIAMGTDGSASNNKLDMLCEGQTAAILHNGLACDPTYVMAFDVLQAMTAGGKEAQGRDDRVGIQPGADADLVLFSADRAGMYPADDPLSEIMFSADRSDVRLTMADGEILYEDGEYTKLDTEKVKYDFIRLQKEILS